MNRQKWLIGVGLWAMCLFFIITVSCQKWEIKHIDAENYRPEIALPIGVFEISVMDFINGADLPIINPDDVIPGASLIYYDNNYYAAPATRFDTITSIDFEWNIEAELIDDITQIIFRSNFINYSNTSVYCQVYFFNNESKSPFDSLYQQGQQFINAGVVRSDGTIQQAESLRNDELFNKLRLERFKGVNRIDIAVSFQFNPVSGQVIRYESDQFMWIQLASRVGLDIDVNQL